MKYRRTVGSLAALATVVSGSALVALAAPSYAGVTTGPSFPLKSGDNSVTLLRGSNGSVGAVEAKDKPIARPKGASKQPVKAAEAHLDRFAPDFGVSAKELKSIGSSDLGDGSIVKVQQYKNGLPVIAGELAVALNRAGDLEAIVGKTVQGVVDVPASLIGEARAQRTARDYIAKDAKVAAHRLKVTSKGRAIYNPSLLGAPGPATSREVYWFTVRTSDYMVDYDVLVDRGLNTVALTASNNHKALSRKVCDLNNQDAKTLDGAKCDGKTVAYSRQEGGAASGIADVDAVYDKLGETAKWYASYVNVDVSALIGGDEKALKATTRVCASDVQEGCPLQNAFWSDGLKQMIYGEGYTTQDVTAHELTHGVTAHTSKLWYAWQSGAINESMSDVFGEVVDLAANPSKQGTDAAWQIGDDMPGGKIRDMRDPGDSSLANPQPDRLTSDLWYADEDYLDDGGVHFNSGPGNKAAYLIAQGDNFNGFDVRGLGLAKTFKIYWTAQNLLTSGADYKDLFNVLPLSCRRNVGKAGTYITEDDCVQVDKAVRATEMYKDPASAAPTATPYCDKGTVKASYAQGFDAKPSDWEFVGGALLTSADFKLDYVNTGKDALGLVTWEAENVPSATATSDALSIPAGSQLRFDYATLFTLYQPLAGATMKFEYNDGSGWKAASGLAGAVNGGPWTKHSTGWAPAKYDLSSLAGKKVQFRFTVTGLSPDAAKNPVSEAFVDNFKIYTCA